MRKTLGFLFFFISGVVSLQAQTAPPNGMIYQAVARDGSGNLAVRRTIYVQTTVLKGSATGTIMYADEHKVNSNADAMFTVIVGQGTYLSGTFKKLTDIPWDKDKYFFNLKICVAPSIPGTGWKKKFVDIGTTQFWTVPYAMQAGKSSDSLQLIVNGNQRQIKLGNYSPVYFTVADGDTLSSNELQTISLNGGRLILSQNGGLVNLPDSSAVNELQNIIRVGGKITLSQGGGSFVLPDSLSNNEIQSITRTGGRISLDLGGGQITLPDSSSTNEIQSITRTGGRISLDLGGGQITLPDSSSTNEIQSLKLKGDSLLLSNSNGVDLYPVLGAGTVKMKDYKIPDGMTNAQKIKVNIVPYTTTSPSTTSITPYTVPAGKNLYIKKVNLTTPFWQCSAGFYVNGALIIPSSGAGCGYVHTNPILVGENMVITANLGCSGSQSCSYWYCDFEGYLVDKTVTVICDKNNYTVPSGNIFVVVGISSYPDIYTSGEVVPAGTNGYLLKK
jgi:hypothetical protein